GAAVLWERAWWTPWPMANPPANRAIATETLAIADGILMGPLLSARRRQYGRRWGVCHAEWPYVPFRRPPRPPPPAAGENARVDAGEPSLGRMLWRGATRRCARCRARKLVPRVVPLGEPCPRCRYPFHA